MATRSKPQKTRGVTFSVEHTTLDGKSHKRGTTAQLPALEARSVVFIGHGRYADASTPDAEPPPGEAETKKEQGR